MTRQHLLRSLANQPGDNRRRYQATDNQRPFQGPALTASTSAKRADINIQGQ